MSKIDISKWGEFEVGELFDIHPTKAYKMTNSTLMELDGENEVIVNSSFNNGVGGYTNQNNTECGNIITFSDTTSAASIFYHEQPFVGYAHVQGMYPIGKYKNCWTKYSYLFFVTIYRNRAMGLNYDYVNKFTRESAKQIIVKLPINTSGDLNFEYMEDYIKEIENSVKSSLNKFEQEKYLQNKCNIINWKPFHLYDIFDIDSGTKMDRIAMKFNNPTINFVGRSGVNNGVTACVDEVEGYKPYKAGNLTLALGGAYLGSCFVQDKDFYTSQNVVVLIPKFEMSFNTKQFICSVIFKEGNIHYKAFIDELNRHIKTDFTIKLPIDNLGNIDYQYMDNYIENIRDNVLNKFKIYQGISKQK